MIKKLALLIMLVTFISTPAWAGNIPEFDAVGDDSANYFNDMIQDMVAANNIDSSGVNLNENSDFTVFFDYDEFGEEIAPWEYFKSSASFPGPSPCFGAAYSDRKAGPYFPNYFEWQMVLQMAPETDLDLMIRDCVLKENQRNIWFYAQQTGRWRRTDGKLIFSKNRNPRITVTAIPGIMQPAQVDPFIMDARRMPTLNLTPMDNVLYTSKALWQEGIVLVMPEPGFNRSGQPTFPLREGDRVHVRIDVPWNNPVDIYYGQDNVEVKYVGIIGIDLTTVDLL